jgi:hypothetical protein
MVSPHPRKTIAKLRLTMPPIRSGDFAFALEILDNCVDKPDADGTIESSC